MSKSVLQVFVEVTDEVREMVSNRGKSYRQQTVYVDTGGRYPEEAGVFVDDRGGPLKPGRYLVSKVRKNGFAFELDFRGMQLSPPVGVAKG